MKATGIVRRVDGLGRIVIPKEIRRTLKVREEAPSRTTFTNGVNTKDYMNKTAEQVNLLRLRLFLVMNVALR